MMIKEETTNRNMIQEKTGNLNNGDVIVIDRPQAFNYAFAIFNKFGDDNTLHIYVELNSITGDLYFPCDDFDFSYDMDKITYRLATDLEKNKLYNALYSYFTEEYDYDWSSHFTDSSYFDILDCLLEAFCIHVSEEDNWDYPEFVQDIRNYIWDICCNVLGVKNDITEFEDEDKPKMVNLDDICKWLVGQAGNYSVEVADAIENDIVPQLKKVMGE